MNFAQFRIKFGDGPFHGVLIQVNNLNHGAYGDRLYIYIHIYLKHKQCAQIVEQT